MVLKQYSQITHDDSKHKTSAKRDTANGVCGIDASKEVINDVPVSKLVDMSEQSFINIIKNASFEDWNSGVSSAPDSWVLSNATCLRESTPTPKIGSYTAKIVSNGTYAYLKQDVSNYADYKGRTVTIGAWCYAESTNTLDAAIYLKDGVGQNGITIPKDDAWHWLTATLNVNSSATYLQARLFSSFSSTPDTDDVAFFDGVMVVEGSICPAFSLKPVSFIGWNSLPPFLDENSANVANKPTLITRGLFGGYSLPEYAAGEELLFRMRVPHSWDGITNPWFVAITSASASEGIGDKYKFQLEWQAEDILHVIPDTTAETLTDEVTLTDGSAFYANIVAFELDGSLLTAGENLQARLRRIAASSLSVTNEVIVWHWDTRWKLNKIGTESIQGY